MPGIADAIDAPRPRPGPAPMIPKALAAMPDDLRAKAKALLASDRSDYVVAAAFTDSGYPINHSTVRNHRQTHRLGRFAP